MKTKLKYIFIVIGFIILLGFIFFVITRKDNYLLFFDKVNNKDFSYKGKLPKFEKVYHLLDYTDKNNINFFLDNYNKEIDNIKKEEILKKIINNNYCDLSTKIMGKVNIDDYYKKYGLKCLENNFQYINNWNNKIENGYILDYIQSKEYYPIFKKVIAETNFDTNNIGLNNEPYITNIVKRHNNDLLKILLENKKTILYNTDVFGKDALDIAIINNNYKIIDTLLENGFLIDNKKYVDLAKKYSNFYFLGKYSEYLKKN